MTVSKYFEAYLETQRDWIYLSFSIVSNLVALSFAFQKTTLLPWFLGLFLAFFLFSKIHGQTLDYTIKQSQVTDMHMWRLFLLSFALYIVALSKMFSLALFDPETQKQYYILASFVYIFAGLILFFDWKKYIQIQKWSHKHIIQALILGGSILCILFFYWYEAEDNSTTAEVPPPVTNIPNETPEEEIIPAPLETKKVKEVYDIVVGLTLGSQGTSVENLQSVLKKLSYYSAEISGSFDETTKLALKQALIEKCAWPQSTQGIFGNQAKACIDELDIVFP